MSENDKEPKIANLRELINQLEAPKKKRHFGTAGNNVFGDEEGINAFTEAEKNAKAPKVYGKRTSGAAKKSHEQEERFTTADKVYDYALNLLTMRDYSKAEMLDKLQKKGACEAFAREAVAKLLEYNFLNEERYAFRVYEMWLNKRVYGRMHLQAELKKRSIEAECIAKVLEKFTTIVEEERAEAAADLFLQQNRKKLQDLRRLEAAADGDNNEDVETIEFDLGDASSDAECLNSLKKAPKKTTKWGSRWRINKPSKAAERMAALKKLQAAAGRFMVARGFSARYMHIVLSRLHQDNDM